MLPKPMLFSRTDSTTTPHRRTFLGGAMAALLAAPARAVADDEGDDSTLGNPFILLLHGLYEPVPADQGPNLGLTSVNLNDGTYSKTKIYPVFQAPGGTNGENSQGGAMARSTYRWHRSGVLMIFPVVPLRCSSSTPVPASLC